MVAERLTLMTNPSLAISSIPNSIATDYQFVKKRVIRTWEIISKRAAGFYAETMAHGSMIYRRWLVIVKAEELFGIDRYMDHSLPLTRLAYPTGLFFAVVT